MNSADAILGIGPACFGLLIGWITYRTLRRKEGPVALSDLSVVLGTLGGGVVTGLFGGEVQFAFYSIGLAFGFFGYLVVAWMTYNHESKTGTSNPAAPTQSPGTWMGSHQPATKAESPSDWMGRPPNGP